MLEWVLLCQELRERQKVRVALQIPAPVLPERALLERVRPELVELAAKGRLAQVGPAQLEPVLPEREKLWELDALGGQQPQVVEQQPQPVLRPEEWEYLAVSPVCGPEGLEFSAQCHWLAAGESVSAMASVPAAPALLAKLAHGLLRLKQPGVFRLILLRFSRPVLRLPVGRWFPSILSQTGQLAGLYGREQAVRWFLFLLFRWRRAARE